MAAPAIDTNAGWWMRNKAPSLPSSQYPEGFTIRVLSARAMHDPKDKPKSLQVFEVALFTKGTSTFDSYHARNKRWKTLAEFEQLSNQISGHLGGATAPVLASVVSARSERSPILLEERRVSAEAFMAGIVKLWYSSAKNHKLRQIIAKWLTIDRDETYVVHVNLLSGVDKNTSEFIDPADAKADKEDSMFSGIKAPKMSMPSFGKLSMPKLGMPSMPDIGKINLSLPTFGDTPADIARRAAGAAGLLEERKENQLAYLDSLDDKEREYHVMARALAYIQQNGNGWVYWDEANKSGDHWMFDRELQTATRSLKTEGLLSDSEKKTVYYWDEPKFVNGDVFELPLTKSQSKPGILNWAVPSDSDVKLIRIKVGTDSDNRTIDMEFHGPGGADMAKCADKTSTKKQYKEGPEHA